VHNRSWLLCPISFPWIKPFRPNVRPTNPIAIRGKNKFQIYLELDPPRSIRGAFLYFQAYVARTDVERLRTSAPLTWNYNSAKWKWRQRAEEYDLFRAAIIEREREARKALEREQRYDSLQFGRAKLMRFLDAMDPSLHEIRPSELLRMVTVLNEDSRKEFGEDVKRTEQAVNVQVTFADLLKLSRVPIPGPETPAVPATTPTVAHAPSPTPTPAPATPDPGDADIIEGEFYEAEPTRVEPATPETIQ
jgi:hypothetical protein